MPPFRSETYIHSPRSSPLNLGGVSRNPSTLSPLNGQAVGDESGCLSARNPPPGLVGPNSRLMFQGGTQHFSVQQNFHETVDMPHRPSIWQSLFGSGSQLLLNGGQTNFQQETHMHYHDYGQHYDALTLLYQRSAPAAVYNSKERFDPPKCHQNTRGRLLNMIQNWASGRNEAMDVVEPATDPQLMWLYGSAGAGKSAIAQTTSEDLSLLCNLAASFFFSRTAPESSYRGDESRFVTTITYQLTEVMPGLRSYVEHAIRNRPSIFNLTLCEQVMALIVEPLREVIRDNADMDLVFIFPKVIVVDGLDECKDEAGQKQVLEAIATLIGHPEIFPFSVFLASRPELAIRTWIASKQSTHPNLIQRVSLLDHCDSDYDIEVFVKADVAEIREVHPLRSEIPADWPSPEPIQEIVKRASGQFVYASTVMKYVKDLRNDPRQRLESILQNTIAGFDRPYAELDALYLHILRQTQHPTLVHLILAFRLVTASFWGALDGLDLQDCLQNLLSLPQPVPMLLVDLQSIMNCDIDGMEFLYYLGNKKITSLSIPVSAVFHHASFVEFLLDPQRSEEFYVDKDKFDEELFQIALKNIRDRALEEADKSEGFVIYCFLTILQTQTSHRPFFLDQISVELSKWDTLNETMLYDILRRLAVKHHAVENVRLLDIIDLELWKHFAPVVERRRIRCHQALKSAGLPLELFAISERTKDFGLGFVRGACDFCGVHNLLEWHIFFSIHHSLGADDVRSLFLDDFRATSATPFGSGPYRTGFYDFVLALKDLSKQELAAVQREKWDSEWDIGPELGDAVIFYFKHLISLLDPSEDIRKPKEVIAVFDRLKGRLGEHWRALTAAYLLSGPSRLVWHLCPISKDIATALDDICNLLFSPDVTSSIEDAALPFDFPYPQSKREILNSFKSPCGLPCWLKAPWDNFLLGVSTNDIRYDLCYLHDCQRMYNALGLSGDGRDRDDNDSDMTSTDGGWDKNWSLAERVGNFIMDYEKAEEKHKEMTEMKNSNKL